MATGGDGNIGPLKAPLFGAARNGNVGPASRRLGHHRDRTADSRASFSCWRPVAGPQTAAEHRYYERLRNMAEEKGLGDRIRFLGQRSDVPSLLAAADIFCQPNTGPEPFGIVFVEALYAGLPVVTSAFGGPLEIIDSSCGILAPPGDVGALADALGNLVLDPAMRGRLAESAPARAAAVAGPARSLRLLYDALATAVPPH